MPKANALLEKLQERIAAAKPRAARLRPAAVELYSDEERDWIRQQILTLRRIYGLEWFVRQEMFGRLNLEELADEELRALLHSVERAVLCIREGVSFEDAGLIRTQPDD